MLLLSGAIAWGMSAVPCSAAEYAPIIEHGPRDSKMVALTFDACKTGLPDDFDGAVIDILMRENVHATIFMSGMWVERNRDGAEFLAEQPQFEIANHAYSHPHLIALNNDAVLGEFRRTQALLAGLTGRRPAYFRPPYGEVNERIAALAEQAGLVTIQYDIASGDPDPNLRPERIVRAILRDARGGSIIVFHVNRHGVHTAEILPAIIAGLRAKGFELVTVGEMLEGRKGDAGESEVPGDRPTSITTEEY
jgi:peptidoglycan/xylan/chitin deacetylase (PgdA/CDA1 family)